MDFFEQQSRAKRRTGWLVLTYAVFVAGLVAAVHGVVSFGLSLLLAQQRAEAADGTADAFLADAFAQIVSNPQVLLGSVGAIAAIIGVATLVKTAQLAQGGSAVAKSMQGREILPNTRNFRERRLLNIVEEMALASGVAMPRVFVMDDEPGVNAFAAGYTPKDSAIAVTRGALDLFSRDELQAVVGHEFSHILNGDMRLNIRMIGVLFGILCISLLGSLLFRGGAQVLRSSSRSRKKDNGAGLGLALMVFGGAVWLLGSLGVLCSRLIQAMISRQREYLADSSSVQFTRNPDGMAGALKVIGAATHGSRISNPHASEVSHMLFASGLRSSLFATHPPLEARIRQIDPRFDGDFKEAQQVVRRRMAMRLQQSEADEENELHRGVLYHILAEATHAAPEPASAGSPSPAAGGGVPTPPPLQATGDGLSEAERDALRTVEGAEACFLGALVAAAPEVQRAQLARIADGKGDALASAAAGWRGRLATMDGPHRRMTCEIAVNTLRPQARKALEATAGLADALVMADGQIDPFEFAMTRMFRARLLPDVRASRKGETIAREAAAFVLHVLATFGTPERAQADRAWQAGAGKLASFGRLEALPGVNVNDLARFDEALKDLVRLPPVVKREFMEACQTVVGFDGALNETEENFLFAIADVIEATGWNAGAAPIYEN